MAAVNGIQNGASHDTGALNILVVGAGIGGLTAAIALRQQGHSVKIFEQSRFANETGAAIHLQPNSNGILRRLGLNAEDIGANLERVVTEYNSTGEKTYSRRMDGDMAAMWQNPWQLVHRIHLHQELKRMATEKQGKGTPAELHTTSRIVEVDCQKASITLESGETVRGDVVIGADGVHSTLRRFVADDTIKAFGSGKSAFRWLVPKESLLKDPNTADFVKQDGELIMWIGDDRRLVMYPCSSDTVMNFVAIHPSTESDASSGEWNEGGSRDQLLKVYDTFGAKVKTVLSHADPETLKLWVLYDMKTLPVWTKENVALLGDAAHPFLPHQGQGGGQAIEDAASIAVVLPYGTPKEEIPERLKLYEKCRHERATKIQHFTRLAGRDAAEFAASGEKLDMGAFSGYNFGHDEWHHSTQMLRKWEWAKKPNLYWRMPVGFGPSPGPRQDFLGNARSGMKSTFKQSAVRFKTSRTLLQNLFPTDSFSFASPATVAEASFMNMTIDRMEWLGGQGYNHCGLYIHGVKYTKKDGSALHGTFLAVLFESLSDPITTGREELGMPKLFCDIGVAHADGYSQVKLGWRGAQFGELRWDNLQQYPEGATAPPTNGAGPEEHSQQLPDDGTFAYRYVPAVGERGKADAEYPTFVSRAGNSEERVVSTGWSTKDASVNFTAGDWKSLPTLHHVSSRLAEIPVYGIVEAKVEEGTGVEDVSQCCRIE